MINFGKQYSTERPSEIEITSNSVFIATDITPYSDEIEGHQINGFQYNYTQYSKDEFLLQQQASIASLQEELRAAKILLGVD